MKTDVNVARKLSDALTYILSGYQDIVALLAAEAPLSVAPESSRRIITMIEEVEKSAKSGHSAQAPYEELENAAGAMRKGLASSS